MALAGLFLAPAVSHGAGAIVEEDFVYPDGPLAGQGGGVGWSGVWKTSTNYFVSGGRAVLSLNSNSVSIERVFAAPITNPVTYFSGVFTCTDSNSYRAQFQIAAPSNSRAVQFGLSAGTFEVILRGTNSTQSEPEAGSYPRGTGVLLVARFELDASGTNEQLSLWANPGSLETQPPTVSVQYDTSATALSSLKLLSYNVDNGVASYGRIRVGTTWADVVPQTNSSPPVISLFAALPDSIVAGGTTTLKWQVADATGGSIADAAGEIAALTNSATGTLTVSPTNSTAYTLTATNPWGSTVATAHVQVVSAPLNPPNFLFIAIDDLKTIAGYFAAEPGNFLPRIYPDPVKRAAVLQVLTPNLDRLAAQGVSFRRAYCAAPACNPSRAALMTGIRPHLSGLTDNDNGNFFRNYPLLQNAVTIPQNLRANGYFAAGCGKIYHAAGHSAADSAISWTKWIARPIGTANATNSVWCPPSLDWGAYYNHGTNAYDYLNADFIARLLENGTATIQDTGYGTNVTVTLPASVPFFLACGLFRPHLPYYAPTNMLALFNPGDITVTRQMLSDFTNDLRDLPPQAMNFISAGIDTQDRVLSHDRFADAMERGLAVDPGDGDLKGWRDMLRHYLASVAYADRCVGRLLDGLERSPFATNTIVVLWSDHGYHLGEKLYLSKFTLWEQSANVVCIIKDPTLKPSAAGIPCYRPVGLGDLYRTICSRAGVPVPGQVAGHDLSPLLADPRAAWNIPALTTYAAANHNTIRTENYRYIRYHGNFDEAELYDHDLDPCEITNIIWPAFASSTNTAGYTDMYQDATNRLLIALSEGAFPDEQQMNLYHWRQGYWGVGLSQGESADPADPDDDGMTNLQEYRARTNPLDITSVLQMTSASFESGGFKVFFPTVSGVVYHLLRSDDLNTWAPVGPDILGTGEVGHAIDPDAMNPDPRYYRILLVR